LTEPRDASAAELEDWDARAVDAPGGHVYQSRAWAEHRAGQGWRPRFLAYADGERALALTRSWPLIGGGSAYVPRGPRPDPGAPDATAARLVSLAAVLEREAIDVVAADPEVPAADVPFRAAIERAGFRPIDEIQPSRHRITRPLAGLDEESAFAAIAKGTRQRIRKAERDGVAVARHDARAGHDAVADPGEVADPFRPPVDASDRALDRFYDLLLATGERRHFSFGSRADFVGWWRRALPAGHVILLEAWAPGEAGGATSPSSMPAEPLAGLLLYRHGNRLSTVHSADRAETRRDHPGALHLLRWRALQLALREGRAELDLGGVDVAGQRHEPREGEAMWGLYEHKRAFGGQWLELTGAHERVGRRWRYAAGRVTGRATRAMGRVIAPRRATG
jgi:lipid II:glycine glycyltransferase (peptidoglycan interpeptide bridge formation enzyme)